MEKKAQAVVPSAKEIKEIIKKKQQKLKEMKESISGKQATFIHLQQQFHEAYLIRIVKQIRLETLGKKLEAVKRVKSDDTYVSEFLTWRGDEYTYRELASEFDLENFYYKVQIRNELNLKNELMKTYKISMIQINEILRGRYVRLLPK